MSFLSIKVTINENSEEEARKKKQRELEDFLHEYREFLKPSFIYDPILIERFRMDKERILREHDLGFHERMLIQTMERNIRVMERRRQYEETIIGDDNPTIWFLY